MKITNWRKNRKEIEFREKTEFYNAVDNIVKRFGHHSIKPREPAGTDTLEVFVEHDREYLCEYTGPGAYGSDLIYNSFEDFWNDREMFGNHYVGLDGDHHLAEYTFLTINDIPCSMGVSENGEYYVSCKGEDAANRLVSWMQDV